MKQIPDELRIPRKRHLQTRYPGDLAADVGVIEAKKTRWIPGLVAAAAIAALTVIGIWWTPGDADQPGPVVVVTETPSTSSGDLESSADPSSPVPRRSLKVQRTGHPLLAVRLKVPLRPELNYTRWKPNRFPGLKVQRSANPQETKT